MQPNVVDLWYFMLNILQEHVKDWNVKDFHQKVGNIKGLENSILSRIISSLKSSFAVILNGQLSPLQRLYVLRRMWDYKEWSNISSQQENKDVRYLIFNNVHQNTEETLKVYLKIRYIKVPSIIFKSYFLKLYTLVIFLSGILTTLMLITHDSKKTDI